MLSNFHSKVFREKCKGRVWGKLQRRLKSTAHEEQGRKMKLQKGEMLSNFEIESFCRELKRITKKQSGAGSGGLPGGLQEALGGAPGASGELLGGSGCGPDTAGTIFVHFFAFFQNSGPVLRLQIEAKIDKNR